VVSTTDPYGRILGFLDRNFEEYVKLINSTEIDLITGPTSCHIITPILLLGFISDIVLDWTQTSKGIFVS
jgi:hypothetical protein